MGRWVYFSRDNVNSSMLIDSNKCTLWCKENVKPGYYSPVARTYNPDFNKFMDGVYFFEDEDFTMYMLVKDSL